MEGVGLSPPTASKSMIKFSGVVVENPRQATRTV